MELQHINAKVYLADGSQVEPRRIIDVFHEWIRKGVFDELLIDVADYSHVPAGPGVMLIGHEADYSLDNAHNRPGLRYNRKSALTGDNEARFRQALLSALRACQLLESEFTGDDAPAFSRTHFDLFINDRALAPNTVETFAAAKPELEAVLAAALGHRDFEIARDDDARALFRLCVKLGSAYDLDAMIGQLAC
jgi:hypothetical protein